MSHAEACRKWREKNLDTDRAKKREYQRIRRQDPEFRATQAEYQREHAAQANETVKRWLARDGNASARRNKRRTGEAISSCTKDYVSIIRHDPCTYCGNMMEEIDHIVPVKHGGGAQWDNLAPACRNCNRSKGTKSLVEFMLGRSR